MDNMVLTTWIGIGLILVLNVIGWFLAYNRYSRNEARHMGQLEGTVKGLITRIEGLEKTMGDRLQSLDGRMGNLEQRLDTFLTNWPGDPSE